MINPDNKMVGEISAHELWRIARGHTVNTGFGEYPNFESLMKTLKLPDKIHPIDGYDSRIVAKFLRKWADALDGGERDD